MFSFLPGMGLGHSRESGKGRRRMTVQKMGRDRRVALLLEASPFQKAIFEVLPSAVLQGSPALLLPLALPSGEQGRRGAGEHTPPLLVLIILCWGEKNSRQEFCDLLKETN